MFSYQRAISILKWHESKGELVRPKQQMMRSGIQALFIIVLAGTLATSVIACPLWIGLTSPSAIPCSGPMSPEKCPHSICLLGSPYLASHGSTGEPALRQLGPAVIDSTLIVSSINGFEPSRSEQGLAPGPGGQIFLRTHSLLI